MRLLHTELTLLNLSIPDNERQPGLFGAATLSLIQNFQQTHNVPITGIVDAATAKAINTAVDALTSTLSGRVYSAQRPGLGGLRIQVLDKNAGPDVLLAEGTTDDNGAYSVRYSTAALAPRKSAGPSGSRSCAEHFVGDIRSAV